MSSIDAITTVLSLSGIGVPVYSARGLTQTLTPIDESKQLRRTINGALKDESMSQFQKFKSTIATGQFTDQDPPSCNGVWPGQVIVVDCISELSYLTATGAPDRPVVAGSSRVEGDFTIYRPQITFRVSNFSIDKDEWEATNSWSMDLEEV
jgi:hypothetical protein